MQIKIYHQQSYIFRMFCTCNFQRSISFSPCYCFSYFPVWCHLGEKAENVTDSEKKFDKFYLSPVNITMKQVFKSKSILVRRSFLNFLLTFFRSTSCLKQRNLQMLQCNILFDQVFERPAF